MEDLLKKLYYDESNPGSLGGVNKLYDEAKKILPTITKDNVKNWLATQNVYTLYKDVRKRWKRNPIIVHYIDQQWEMDLLDYASLSRFNFGYKYIITIIDCFSKFLFLLPVKSKRAAEITQTLKTLLIKRKPTIIRSDQGLEFNNVHFKNLCKLLNINFFTSDNTNKCAIVNRANREVREKIRGYMVSRGTKRYVDKLKNICFAINHKINRSIKMPPADVRVEDEPVLFQTLYNAKNMMELQKQGKLKTKFKVGDKIRRKFDQTIFDKSYHQKWTDIVYKIDKIIQRLDKPQYVVSLEGTKYNRRFNPEELQKVNINQFLIEKIIKFRIRNNKKEALIRWKGYNQNQWIPADQIQKLS